MNTPPPNAAHDESQPGVAPILPQKSIIARTAHGAGWIIAWRLATRIIGLCSTLVLVRLLSPADFGIVSLATGILTGLDAVAGFGVEGAIIRADRADRVILDSGFTINVIRGLTTSLILAAAAVPLSRFFNNAHLVNVIYVLAAGWAVSAFENVGMIEYRRQLAFDMEFKIKIIPRLLALAVTIPTAFAWHSYWALVAGIVSTQLMTVSLTYVMHPYRPRFGIAGMRHIFGFSFWEWLIGLTGLIGGRADTVIIGHLLGAASVGIYGVGGEIASLPTSEIVSPLCRALFSGFVVAKREGRDGAQTLLRVLSVLSLLTFPLNMGLSLVAHPVIKIAFGQDWLGAVVLVQVIGVFGTLSVFSAIGETLFSANAWLGTILSLAATSTVLRVGLLLVLIPRYGLLGGALAAAIVGLVQEATYLAMAMRRLHITARAVIISVLRPSIAVCLMAAVLYATGLGWTDWDSSNAALGVRLAAAVALGGGVYISAIFTLWVAAGRPNTAEADALMMAATLARRVLRRLPGH